MTETLRDLTGHVADDFVSLPPQMYYHAMAAAGIEIQRLAAPAMDSEVAQLVDDGLSLLRDVAAADASKPDNPQLAKKLDTELLNTANLLFEVTDTVWEVIGVAVAELADTSPLYAAGHQLPSSIVGHFRDRDEADGFNTSYVDSVDERSQGVQALRKFLLIPRLERSAAKSGESPTPEQIWEMAFGHIESS